jgi:hypothetical protein
MHLLAKEGMNKKSIFQQFHQQLYQRFTKHVGATPEFGQGKRIKKAFMFSILVLISAFSRLKLLE